MNKFLPLSILSVALLAIPASPEAHATTGIMKCAGADGTAVYTDHACSAGMKAVPMAGALMTRIARDEARYADDVDVVAPPSSIPVSARRSVAAGCARTPEQLSMDLRAAFALGDVNRVAESYHWVGLSTREGERVLDRLQRMAGQPLLDSRYFNATMSDSPLGEGAVEIASNDANMPAGGAAGMLQLQLGQGSTSSVVDLNVERYAGCYFVKF